MMGLVVQSFLEHQKGTWTIIGIIGISLGLVLFYLVQNHSKVIRFVPKQCKPPNKRLYTLSITNKTRKNPKNSIGSQILSLPLVMLQNNWPEQFWTLWTQIFRLRTSKYALNDYRTPGHSLRPLALLKLPFNLTLHIYKQKLNHPESLTELPSTLMSSSGASFVNLENLAVTQLPGWQPAAK